MSFTLPLLCLFCVCSIDLPDAGAAGLPPPESFGFPDVVRKAAALAEQPYDDPGADPLPSFLKNLNYDQWRDIRFNPEQALWGTEDVLFRAHFFHQGFFYQQPVRLNVIKNGKAEPVPFDTQYFDYGKNTFSGNIPKDLGFAGFRLHYPVNTADYYDEIAVFLGASYFRAVAEQQVYGLSGRGLAIDTATAEGEEFPFFKEFWLVKPEAGDRQIKVLALLDSKSVTGAYRVIIRPGKDNIFHVTAALFFRRDVKRLGIGPMNSMFFFGENSFRDTAADFRPEVHDSDGLLIKTREGASAETIWRPLVNPRRLIVNAFQVQSLRGFGLLQRDRNFDHYQDLEARSDKRPSVWLTPEDDWGPGQVQLVQIPTVDEYQDNIVAFWVPEQLPQAGERLDLSYTLTWFSPDADTGSGRAAAGGHERNLAYVADTRLMQLPDDEALKFVLNFEGSLITDLPADAGLTADISVSEGYRLREHQVLKNDATGGWNLVFVIEPEQDFLSAVRQDHQATELRVFLANEGRRISEVWTWTVLP